VPARAGDVNLPDLLFSCREEVHTPIKSHHLIAFGAVDDWRGVELEVFGDPGFDDASCSIPD